MTKYRSKLFLVASVFTASLLTSMAQEDQFKAPDNVATPPADAEKTASGLASIVLQKGTGTEKPEARDTVNVHYTGWQSSNGNMFDSSVQRGEKISFPLNQVIKGWTEGLQLMVIGEKRRFWIPEDLAYGPEVPDSGRPGGQLVFDVELFEIEKAPEPIKAPEGAAKTEGGYAYIIKSEGAGESPAQDKNIKFHYTFFSPDGQAVQSSKTQGGAQTAPFAQLPPFFTEVFSKLKKGGVAEVYIPGEQLRAPDALVKAELELVDIVEPIPAPTTPEDVAAVPADAKKTESGLAYKALTTGEGGAKPAETSTVTVHYSGWETNGELFDSSVTRGESTSFPLNGVIKGWTEGLQLMSKGDKFRFWIPEDLAYGPKQEGSGRPGGLLVFDVELLEFK